MLKWELIVYVALGCVCGFMVTFLFFVILIGGQGGRLGLQWVWWMMVLFFMGEWRAVPQYNLYIDARVGFGASEVCGCGVEMGDRGRQGYVGRIAAPLCQTDPRAPLLRNRCFNCGGSAVLPLALSPRRWQGRVSLYSGCCG